MTKPFRFAVQATNLSDRETVVLAARQAEDLGYDELFSYDHLGTVDPFMPLIVAAEATTRLRVGPLVLNNELHHPVLLARAVATADRLSGGRFTLGIGTGYARAEHEAMGIEFRTAPARVDRVTESVDVLRALLDTGSAELAGRFHHVNVGDLGVRPIQARVPILVGGNGRRLIESAARWADIFQFTGMSHKADGTPRLSTFLPSALAKRVRWLERSANERNDLIERSALVQSCVVGEGAAAAAEQATRRLGLDHETVATTPFLMFGTVEQLVEKILGLRDTLGFSHFVVREVEGFAPVVAALDGM